MANEVKIQITANDLASGKVSKLRRGISGVNSTIEKNRRGMLAAGAASIAFGTMAVRAAADFDKGMREVNTLINFSNAELDLLGGEVRKLSKEFGINAVDATKALYSAISAGQEPADAIKFLGVAAKTSIGGVTDLETAVDGLTSIVNAYGMKSSETQAVADIMFETMRRGKTTIGELSDFFFQAAPVSSALGVTFEELSAAITTLTLSGTPTRVAMTQIRSAMVSLAKPTKEMEGLFEAVGFESGLAAMKSEGLVGALNKLQDESGATEVEFIKAVGSIESLAAVMGLTGKNTPAFLDSMAAMEDAAGNVDNAYAIMAESTSQSFAIMTASMQDAKIEIGENLAPALEEAAAAATKASEAIALVPAAATTGVLAIGAGGGLIAIIQLLASKYKGLGTQIIRVTRAFPAFWAATASASFAPLILGAGLFTGAIALMWHGMNQVSKTADKFEESLHGIDGELKTIAEQEKYFAIENALIDIENQIGAMSFKSIKSFHAISKSIDGFLTDSYLSLDATVEEVTGNIIDETESMAAVIAAQNAAGLEDAKTYGENIVAASDSRYAALKKQRWQDVKDEKDAASASVKAADEEAEEKEQIRRRTFDQNVAALHRKLAEEMKVADLARQANEALENENKAAFASLFQSVMNLPSVISSNINQGRGFGDDMLGQGTGKDIFSQMGANAMIVPGFESGNAVTKSITGQFGFVAPTRGIGFGSKNSGSGGNIDMEERFKTFISDTIALNRQMGNMNPIIINGDVYGIDDLVTKIADANTQAVQLGMN